MCSRQRRTTFTLEYLEVVIQNFEFELSLDKKLKRAFRELTLLDKDYSFFQAESQNMPIDKVVFPDKLNNFHINIFFSVKIEFGDMARTPQKLLWDFKV